MELVYYRPGIYYYETDDPKEENLKRFWTGLAKTKKEALDMVDSNITRQYAAMLDKYPGTKLTISRRNSIFTSVYIKKASNTVDFLAVGTYGEIYKISNNCWMYVNFHIIKHENTFIVTNFNDVFIQSVSFNNDDASEEKAFEEALCVIDDLFYQPKYLRDNKYGSHCSAIRHKLYILE